MSAREDVAEAIRYTLAIHPWGRDLPYPFSEYVERLKLEIADAAIAAYRKSTGVLSFGVQCSVCTQTANMATQPDPSGWVCPRCAEVAPSAAEVCEIEPPAEFGPHDIVAQFGDGPLGWMIFCNCGCLIYGANEDLAHGEWRAHKARHAAASEADEDDQPLGEKPPLGGLGGLIGGPW